MPDAFPLCWPATWPRTPGHKLAHENEAPFPLTLAEFFVKSFCPPGGTVLDPFSGSGTTMHACEVNGRNGIGTDIRLEMCQLGRRRLDDVRAKAALPAKVKRTPGPVTVEPSLFDAATAEGGPR